MTREHTSEKREHFTSHHETHMGLSHIYIKHQSQAVETLNQRRLERIKAGVQFLVVVLGAALCGVLIALGV